MKAPLKTCIAKVRRLKNRLFPNSSTSPAASLDGGLWKQDMVAPLQEMESNVLSAAGLAHLRDPDAEFSDIFHRYQLQVRKADAAGLQKFALEHPLLASMCSLMDQYARQCDLVCEPIAGSMRRMFQPALGPLNSERDVELLRSKTALPLAMIMSQPHQEPMSFIHDALNGLCRMEEITVQSVMSKYWSGTSSEEAAALRSQVEESIDPLSPDFLDRFQGRETFLDKLVFQCQYEIALNKLLDDERPSLMVIGDAWSPTVTPLFDRPRHKRPPIMYLPHGISWGDPVADLFANVDHACCRGEAEENYYKTLGIPTSKITRVGTFGQDRFPQSKRLEQSRIIARLKCDVVDESPIIVYATTYETFVLGYATKTAKEIQKLLIESLSLLPERYGLKNPVLYLKYHPAPTADPTYSYSRRDYPLSEFFELTNAGYSVRLVSTFEDCLPAADCLIAHESSVLYDAISRGVGTVSIQYEMGQTKPALGAAAYQAPSCHRLVTVYDQPDRVARAIHDVVSVPHDVRYAGCQRDFRRVFECDRTEGLVRFARVAESLMQEARLQ